jgi:hypothetical protein
MVIFESHSGAILAPDMAVIKINRRSKAKFSIQLFKKWRFFRPAVVIFLGFDRFS